MIALVVADHQIEPNITASESAMVDINRNVRDETIILFTYLTKSSSKTADSLRDVNRPLDDIYQRFPSIKEDDVQMMGPLSLSHSKIPPSSSSLDLSWILDSIYFGWPSRF